MNSHMRRILLLCAVAALPGCAVVLGTLAVSGALAYGEMKVVKSFAYTDYRASVTDTFKAVLAQLKELKVEPQEKVSDPGKSRVKVNGTWADIEVHPSDRSYTRVTVDVGVFGAQDEKLRRIRKFLNQVGERLGQESRVPEYPGAEQTGKRESGTSGAATDDRAYEK